VNGLQTVSSLSELLGVGRTEVVIAGFEQCGWLLTIHDPLLWHRVEGLANAVGCIVRQGPDYSDPDQSA
jgi:hypothetical protein